MSVGIVKGKAIEAATGVTPMSPIGRDRLTCSIHQIPTRRKRPKTYSRSLVGLKNPAVDTRFGRNRYTTGATALAARYYLDKGGSINNLGSSLHGIADFESATMTSMPYWRKQETRKKSHKKFISRLY